MTTVTYKRIAVGTDKVMADAAIRDGNGLRIDTGYQKEHSMIEVTLAVNSWSSSIQTVSATGVTTTNTVVVSPTPDSYSAYQTCGVYCTAQGSGTLTFSCSTTPSAAIKVNVLILS